MKAIRLELECKYDEAIHFYKKAYKLNPELQYRNVEDILIVNGIEYDCDGNIIEKEKIEDREIYIYYFDLPGIIADFIFPINDLWIIF